MKKESHNLKEKTVSAVPFDNAEEVWFWFINAQKARNEGARYCAGLGALPRPCEPTDILGILDKLYRKRALLRDHLLVLRHYGRRQYRPDPKYIKEAIAFKLWTEAFDKIEPIFIQKNIIKEKSFFEKYGSDISVNDQELSQHNNA